MENDDLNGSSTDSQENSINRSLGNIEEEEHLNNFDENENEISDHLNFEHDYRGSEIREFSRKNFFDAHQSESSFEGESGTQTDLFGNDRREAGEMFGGESSGTVTGRELLIEDYDGDDSDYNLEQHELFEGVFYMTEENLSLLQTSPYSLWFNR